MHGKRVACVLLTEGREELSAFAEACFRFSPQIAVRPGEAVFIEVGASRALFSEAGIEARLKALASRFLKERVRVSFADTASGALSAARYPDYARTRNLRDLPLGALLDHSHPFLRDEELEKSVLRMTCILESLGIRNLSEFACLPRESLASRFGRDAVGLMAKVWGDLEHAWPGFRLPEKIVERDEVRDPEAHGLCAELEGCLFVLRGLVDRAMGRLRGRGERVSALEIRFAPEKRQWRVELPLPQGSSAGLMPILRERLAHELGRRPLQGPVEAMEIEVSESVPGAGMQRDFFSRKEEEKEAWDALVARLAQKLGKDRVFVAFPQERYRPERAYLRRIVSVPALGLRDEACQAVGMAGRKAEAPEWAERPARVLKKPEPLSKEGRVLKASNGARWKIVSWVGPERLSGEWWRDARFEGFNRDYYRVVTESGDQLWVFENRKSLGVPSGGQGPALYLHGYFD